MFIIFLVWSLNSVIFMLNILTLSFVVIVKQLNFSNVKNECLIVSTDILSPANHLIHVKNNNMK